MPKRYRTFMRTALRWVVGLWVVYLILRCGWRLVVALGGRDWGDAAGSVLALMILLWMFDTFRPRGPTDLRRRAPNADGSGVTAGPIP